MSEHTGGTNVENAIMVWVRKKKHALLRPPCYMFGALEYRCQIVTRQRLVATMDLHT